MTSEYSKLLWSGYYNQLGIYQPFRLSLLEPRQSNLSNPETYSEPCQTSMIKYFAKIGSG